MIKIIYMCLPFLLYKVFIVYLFLHCHRDPSAMTVCAWSAVALARSVKWTASWPHWACKPSHCAHLWWRRPPPKDTKHLKYNQRLLIFIQCVRKDSRQSKIYENWLDVVVVPVFYNRGCWYICHFWWTIYGDKKELKIRRYAICILLSVIKRRSQEERTHMW